MILELIIISIISLASFLLGFFVFLKNPKNNAHIFLGLLCANSAIWALIIVLENILPDHGMVIILNKVDFTIGSFITYFLLIFCKSFASKKKLSKLQHISLLIPPVFLAIISVTSNLLVDHVEFKDNNPIIIKGTLYPLMYIYFWVYTVYSFYILISKFRQFFGIRKRQILYFIIGLSGTSFFWLSGSFISLFLPHHQEGFLGLWSRYSIYAIFFCTFFFAWAIARYRFMDFRVAIKRQAINSLLLVFSLVTYSYLVISIEKILRQSLNIDYLASTFSVVIVIVLGFFLLKKIIWKFSNKFIKEKYNFEKIIADLAPALEKTFKIKGLFKILYSRLGKILSIKKTYLLLFNNTGKVNQRYPKVIESDLNPTVSLLYDYFQKEDKSLVIQEIPFIIEEKIFTPFSLIKTQKEIDYLKKFEEQKNKLEKIEKILSKSQIGIVFPLKSEGRLIGLLFLSNKTSKGMFTESEITFLENLKEKIARALQNILLYQQTIKRIEK